MDREEGFDPTELPEDHDWESLDCLDCLGVVRRDLAAVQKADMLYMLPGWRQSKGARAERAVADWLGLPVYEKKFEQVTPDTNGFRESFSVSVEVPTIASPPPEDILEEALRITKGDRNASYGPPDQDFARTAAMWSALKGVTFEAREVALFMIALKLSRETHQRKRDNWVDLAGYARCGSLCR
jgi:hypothetical protein